MHHEHSMGWDVPWNTARVRIVEHVRVGRFLSHLRALFLSHDREAIMALDLARTEK